MRYARIAEIQSVATAMPNTPPQPMFGTVHFAVNGGIELVPQQAEVGRQRILRDVADQQFGHRAIRSGYHPQAHLAQLLTFVLSDR